MKEAGQVMVILMLTSNNMYQLLWEVLCHQQNGKNLMCIDVGWFIG